MSKIVYLYDEGTGEFLSVYEAQESPLEDGIFIHPNCATDLPPVSEVEGKYNYFNGTSWELKDDPRGIWFKPTGEPVNIVSTVEVVSSEWTREAPPPTVDAVNAARKHSIFAELSAIDLKSIRPAREGDTARLAELEAQAQALRVELSAL